MANRPPGKEDKSSRPPGTSGAPARPPSSESNESFRTPLDSTSVGTLASALSPSDNATTSAAQPASPTGAPPPAPAPVTDPESSIDRVAPAEPDSHDEEPPAAESRKKKLKKRKENSKTNDKESSTQINTAAPRQKPKPPSPVHTPIPSLSETSLQSEALVREERLALPPDIASRRDTTRSNIVDLLRGDLGGRRAREDNAERAAAAQRNVPVQPSAVSTRTNKSMHKAKHKDGPSVSTRSADSAPAKGDHRVSNEEKFHTDLQLGNAFIYMVIPPDGGYGWVIVLISFLCQVIVDGIIFSIGITLPYIAKDMGVSPAEVILVASVQIGPISSAFINKYGFRPVALTGASIAIVVIFLATFTSNLTQMIICYSIIGGPALSMIWVSSQLIIGYYFEKYRPIANGISCSGAGAGILLFSYMNSRIVPAIGWRNATRVHTSFLLTVLLMAISYIEVRPKLIARVHEPDPDTDSDEYDQIEFLRSVRYSKAFSMYNRSVDSLDSVVVDRGLEQMLEEYEVPPHKPSRLRRWCRRCCGMAESSRSIMEMGGAPKKRYVIRNDPMEKQDLFYTGPAAYNSDSEEQMQMASKSFSFISEHSKTIPYTLSVMNPARTQVPIRRTVAQLRISHKYPVLAFLSPRNWLHPKIKRALDMLFDLNMLRIMEFQVLFASAFFFPMGFNIPFVYSKVRAQIDPFHAAMISPAIGFSNLLFRILSGFAAYKYRHHTTYICGGGIIFGGVFVFISAFYGIDVVWFQYVYALCYGVAPAFYSTLRAIIYVRVLGLDKLTNAFGLTAMAMGMGVFVGTTLAATLNELTGSYTLAFAFSGLCLITAGMLKVLLPTLIVWKQRRDKELL